jgi:prophage antirepressor-like protein
MNNLQTLFTNKEFGNIRAIKHESGVIYFVAKDVAKCLGYKKLDAMYRRLSNKQKIKLNPQTIANTGFPHIDTFQFEPNINIKIMVLVTEGGLYKAILGSILPQAEKFQDWVADEVLPSIRKTGGYKSQNKLPETYIEALENLIASEKEKERALLLVEEKTKTINMLVHENKLYTTTEIAKEMNLTSARKLNKILNDEKIQFKQNSTWVLYSRYSNLGYVSIKQNCLDNGKIVYDRKWTGEGREFILSKFNTKNEVMYN